MVERHYDVIVIGGGIHGAGIAQAAAAGGFSVLLLEKSAIGAATSSKSSKLIHGGLRYLESLQFALVKECLRERTILLRIAPDLVKLVPFYIPVYRQTTRRPWQIRMGLHLYRALSGFDNDARFRVLPSQHWESLNGLNKKDLQCVYQYYDGQTDDVALTTAVVHSAQQLGAEFLCPAKFERAEIMNEKCEVQVTHRNEQLVMSCNVLVNASGAWVNEVLKNCSPQQKLLAVDYVQGTHIVVNEQEKTGVFYLEAPQDRRAVFVIPWKGQSMIGTTETLFKGNIAKVAPLDAEKNYLLATYNHYFQDSRKTAADVVDAFAGLRVLPQASESPFHRKRDTQFLTNTEAKPRLITLYGGKLTAYRSTAQRAIQIIGSSLPDRQSRADTSKMRLAPVD